MSANSVVNSQDSRLITCILYQGGGTEILKALRARGLTTANVHHARGSAIGDPPGKKGLPSTFAQEIVTVVVPAEQADEIFDLLHEKGEIDQPRGGFLYMERLRRAVPFKLPEIPEEGTTT